MTVLQYNNPKQGSSQLIRLLTFAQAKFREALGSALSLPAEEQAEAHFGLGETLQNAAEALLSGSRAASDEDVQAAEASAEVQAISMLRQAVEHYSQVSGLQARGSH